jgi:hypothetical protein
MRDLPSKPCQTCGRVMTWRRKWARSWDEVKFCSDACRRRRLDDTDARLEAAILELLGGRSADATICPGEAARRVDPTGWADLMDRTRAAARRLAARQVVQVTQRGRVVDPSTARGPIRLRRFRR